jgi:hypothetical protein
MKQPMQLFNFDELDVKRICNFLEDKIYKEIDIAFSNIDKSFQHPTMQIENDGLLHSLYSKLKEEVDFLKRKEMLILFPFVNKVANHTECRSDLFKISPIEAIKKNHAQLMEILIRVRQLSNNYILKPDWKPEYKIGIQYLHELDQHLIHLLNVKENYLFPKMNDYKCSGNCSAEAILQHH